MAQHTHWDGGPVCPFPTKKQCEDEYANWQADSQVALAQRVVDQGRTKQYSGDKTQFAQLVRVVAGTQEAIMNDEGNPSQSAWARRLAAAISRSRE